MACINDNEPPPAPLSLAWQCERWNALPESGGLYEQDYQLLHQMTACSNVYAAISRLHNAQGAQIHRLSENDRQILGSLVRMGLLFT